MLDFDSESPPYPAPPAIDGTAASAFDGDYGTQWGSWYTDGSPDPLPHWLTFDIGRARTLTGLGYSVKVQDNGPAADVSVYTTTDAGVGADGEADWGEAAGTASFTQPTSNDQIQYVVFDEPVEARYVKFQVDSAVNGSQVASAGQLVVFAGEGGTGPVEPPAPGDPATPVELSNGAGLTVAVAEEFPQVISYDLDGNRLEGRHALLDTFRIDGTDHTARTTSEIGDGVATYTSRLDGLDLTITSTITVTGENTVVFEMTELSGADEASVGQISIPGHSLIAVDSGDPAAQLARTTVETGAQAGADADHFIDVDAATPLDATPVGSPYAFVPNSQLSAGLLSNATEDAPMGNSINSNTRLLTQIVDAGDGARRAEVASGVWTYRPQGATDERVAIYDQPRTTVVLASDLNGTDGVTWQDGAIAYREAMTHPAGSERVPDRVVQHIPFNFGSQATNPFLKTLDNVKRISMSTDNLGQWLLEKGYGNEGHDSGHPDYGGDYNERAGGLADFNTLIDEAEEFNTDLAVHVNATEAYPQAERFGDTPRTGAAGWDWLNQAYKIDQRADLGTGAVLDRFQQLREEAPGLDSLYIDTHLSGGWLADGLAQALQEMGFEISTEYAERFEGDSIWSHWANDKNYGGNQGLTSTIVRFIANSDRDVWNVDPVLGGQTVPQAEGWQGAADWNAFYRAIWTDNLPTKFLQHFPVQAWDVGRSATLSDGEHTLEVRVEDGNRRILMDGALVADGGAYLLPWGDAEGTEPTSPGEADKMYYFNADSAEATTFDLTDRFDPNGTYTLYALSDQGREKVADVSADDGRLTLTGEAGVPYVLAPGGEQAPHAQADYGEHSGLIDPGFNSGDLSPWNPTGGAEIAANSYGDNLVRLGTADSGIAQELTGLEAGAQYTVSASVGIAGGERREVTLEAVGGEQTTPTTFEIQPAKNMFGSSAKKGTFTQRAAVTFVAPPGGAVTIDLSAVAGDAPVTIDDVRLMASDLAWHPGADSAGDLLASDDFEGNQPGWGPFVKGDAGGTSDPKTSISHLNAPYSQREWKNENYPYASGALDGRAVDDVLTGDRSLKAHAENTGLVYRTIPATVPFVEGHTYRISFDYQTNIEDTWAWVTGADRVGAGVVESVELEREVVAPSLETATYSHEIVAGCGDTWVGLRKLTGTFGADFVIDDFTVTDLGEAEEAPTCAGLEADDAVLSPAYRAGTSPPSPTTSRPR